MKILIKVSDVLYQSENGKISRHKINQFKEISSDDLTWGIQEGLQQQQVQNYLKIPHQQCQQQKKINILRQRNINFVPPNIIIPFVYKKIQHLQKIKSYLTSKTVRQNLKYLKKASIICNQFPKVLGKKINYDFFKSISGRVSANIGIIKKQERCNIPRKHQLIQFDFTAFQPMLHRDYFLKQQDVSDPYYDCKGYTRQQKKVSWYRETFSNKENIQFTNVFGRYGQDMLVYHLQALQTDCMSRLLVQLNDIIKDKDIRIIMFLFDGILLDGKKQQIQHVFQQCVIWDKVFPKSNILRYPYKIINI